MPKTGQKNALPREDATEVLVGRVAVPKGAHSTVHRPVRHRFGAGLLRGDGSEAPEGRVVVPKTGQKTPLPRDNLYPMVPLSRCHGRPRHSNLPYRLLL